MSEQKNPYGAGTTGHVWDENLAELTNPPPKWWMLGLHASWILVLVYGILYPMWPTLHGHTKGVLGWTSIKEYKQDLGAIEKVRAKYEDQLKGMSAAQILANPELTMFAKKSAKVLFGDNCAACHGSAGQGNPDFPVLRDDNWIYGGDINTIVTTITGGRKPNMPADPGGISQEEIGQVAQYVKALSEGQGDDPSVAAGKAIFHGKGTCFACHGADAKGMKALGSANLTDQIWRFTSPAGQGNIKTIEYTIEHGVNATNDPKTRQAQMPTFGNGQSKLTKTDIKELAVYVHELGGGQ